MIPALAAIVTASTSSSGDTRAEVIAKYRAWILTQQALLAALPGLRGKILGCRCAPLPCHGDVLAELADASEVGV